MGDGFDISEIVNPHHLNISKGVVLAYCPKNIPAYSSETVNTYLYTHC